MGDLPTVVLRIRILKILSKSVTLVGISFLLTDCAQLGPDLVKAGCNGYNIVLQQTEDEDTPVMVIDSEAGLFEETQKLKDLLGLAIEKDTFIIDTGGDRPRFEPVGIDLRSLSGTFFFASQGVVVPAYDLEMGRAMTTKDKFGKPFDWSLVVGDLISIRSQTNKPDNAQVAIQYRGSWFYIDDSDLNTKYSFLLLDQLAALMGGRVEKAGPLLTLPVSAP